MIFWVFIMIFYWNKRLLMVRNNFFKGFLILLYFRIWQGLVWCCEQCGVRMRSFWRVFSMMGAFCVCGVRCARAGVEYDEFLSRGSGDSSAVDRVYAAAPECMGFGGEYGV